MIQASLPTASKSMCGCADFNDENNLLWTIDRGLLGTLPASHNPSSLPLALTPIAGCSFGTATLTADLGVGDESMNVSAGNWLPPIPTPDSPPTFPQMKIQIDQEILGVMEVSSANSGTTWVVQRGLNGTTPAEHTDSSAAVRLRDIAAIGDQVQIAQPLGWTMLAAAVGVSDSTISLQSPFGSGTTFTGDGFPPNPDNDPNAAFLIMVGSEPMLVTNFSSTAVWSVTRNSPVSHNPADPVALNMDAIVPLYDDFSTTLQSNTITTSSVLRTTGFGRAGVLPGPTVASVVTFVVARVPGTVAGSAPVVQNASPAFLKPFAVDLQATDLQMPLMDALTAQGAVQNVALAPSLMSTNVPPQQ